jgi:hypothetical protein
MSSPPLLPEDEREEDWRDEEDNELIAHVNAVHCPVDINLSDFGIQDLPSPPSLFV